MDIFTTSNGLSGKVVFAPIQKKDKDGEISFCRVGVRVFATDETVVFYSTIHKSWTQSTPQAGSLSPLSRWDDETEAKAKKQSLGKTPEFVKKFGNAKMFANGKVLGGYVEMLVKAVDEIIAECERQSAERRAA